MWLFAAGAPICWGTLATEPEGCNTRPCTYTIRCEGPICTAAEVDDVQRAIDGAQRGDTIRLEAGKVFPVTAAPYGLQLRGGKTGEGHITITTTEAERLPNGDTRITPDYAPLMPTIQANASPFPAMTTDNGPLPGPAEGYNLVGLRFTNHPGRDFSRGLIQIGTATGYKDTFTVDPARNVALTTNTYSVDPNGWVMLYTTGVLPAGLDPNTRYYVRRDNTRGLIFSLIPEGPAVDIMDAGQGQHWYVEQGVTDIRYQPTDIVVDRCIVTGTYDRQIRVGIGLHGRNQVVRNSFIERIQALNVDTQGILSYNGPGPFTIENNYIDGVTENIMFGGARGLSPDSPPADPRGVTSADAVIRFNYLPKIQQRYKWEAWSPQMYADKGKLVYPPSRRDRGYIAQNAGTAGELEPVWPEDIGATVTDGEITWRAYSTNGAHFVVKNNFELKKGERMLIEHNVFDHMWRDGQESAISIKSGDEPGGCVGTGDLTCYAGRTENILFRNNIVRSAPMAFKVSPQNASGLNWHFTNNLFADIDSAAYGTGAEWQMGISGHPMIGLVIDHNTIISSKSAGGISIDVTRQRQGTPIILRNNILSRGRVGMKGPGRAEGLASFELFLCLGPPCNDDQIGRNLILGVNRRQYPGSTFNGCAGDDACEPNIEAVGFRNPSNEDYGLREDSPYRGQATDGTDIGADMWWLPQIRNLQVDAAATQAVFTWNVSEPIREIPCVLQVSTQRNLSEPVHDVNPALFTRADSDQVRDAANEKAMTRRFTVGSDQMDGALDGSTPVRRLSPDTTYYYRLMCGGDARLGSFRTAAQ